jgi:hypothetical protein
MIETGYRGKMSLRFVTSLAIGIYLTCSAAAQERWATYANARFGTTADYPVSIFSVQAPPPDNGDGQAFRSADGRARLTVWGAYNVEGDSPKSYLEKNEKQEGVTFRRITARFYVVSGTQDGDILYERCNFSAGADDVIDCISIAYPAQDKMKWDSIVARLSNSLRNGRAVEKR